MARKDKYENLNVVNLNIIYILFWWLEIKC